MQYFICTMSSSHVSSSASLPSSSDPARTHGVPAAPERANVSWASLIKEQHRHLQGAVVAAAAAPSVVSSLPVSCSLPYEADLQAWRAALDGAEAARRLTAYSVAMHHLATQYWDREPADATTHAEAVAMAKASPSAEPQDASAVLGVGEKRSRAASQANAEAPATKTPRFAESRADEAARTPRHYSDRLRYCLQSTASYFLGETVSLSEPAVASASRVTGESATRARTPTSSCSAAKHATSPAHSDIQHKHSPQPFLIPVHHTVFAQLPGVIARVVKPLRRAFFNVHGRMATGEEVGQLIRLCSPAALLQQATERAGTSEHTESTAPVAGGASSSPRGNEAELVLPLTKSCSFELAALQDTDWRRGERTAWAAALRYIFAPSTPQSVVAAAASSAPVSSSLPPPLYVLDVGSCYGPFHGKCFPRSPPLPSVPLCVTSIDLAPYQESTWTPLSGAHSPPSPRVWQGDWLQMTFFSSDEVASLSEGGEGFTGSAEGGRVRYRSASNSAATASLTEADKNGGMHNAKEEEETTSSSSLTSAEQRDAPHNPPPPSVVALQLESYDAVYFCLLLSYMPTPRLRFLACLHACLALKEGGLLVIVSTRTQGSRRRNWMQEWATCLATIGFQRVQQSAQEKIVGMAFAKVCPSKEVHESWQTAQGRAKWIREMMATSHADDGLRITADDARDQADL